MCGFLFVYIWYIKILFYIMRRVCNTFTNDFIYFGGIKMVFYNYAIYWKMLPLMCVIPEANWSRQMSGFSKLWKNERIRREIIT